MIEMGQTLSCHFQNVTLNDDPLPFQNPMYAPNYDNYNIILFYILSSLVVHPLSTGNNYTLCKAH